MSSQSMPENFQCRKVGHHNHCVDRKSELGKKSRQITTDLEAERTKSRKLEKEKRDLEKQGVFIT